MNSYYPTHNCCHVTELTVILSHPPLLMYGRGGLANVRYFSVHFSKAYHMIPYIFWGGAQTHQNQFLYIQCLFPFQFPLDKANMRKQSLSLYRWCASIVGYQLLDYSKKSIFWYVQLYLVEWLHRTAAAFGCQFFWGGKMPWVAP